jgi:hypothetical protein
MRRRQKGRIHELDVILRQVDAECVERGQPILSVLVRDEHTNEPCAVFWESVTQYDLRLPGETDAACDQRLQDVAVLFHQTIH